ncbi:hypothetical protein EYR41_005684 [Orbilia oligospora]|uniref:Uncharacterized protein n=1 Tax=Orbilia oligospora TaxID=2813651 RepID=A0A7C8KK82_ORBOL|nr:hypothetical protein TWF751_009931 [Orbilia oligospora]TGJ69659.1 hypothetical protein EYR41_005684 [Orbilia oligospora]
MSISIVAFFFTSTEATMFFQPQQREGTGVPPCTDVLGDIDCNFNDFVSVDAYLSSTVDFDFSTNFGGFLDGGGGLEGGNGSIDSIDSFLDFSSIDTASNSQTTTSTTPSQGGGSGDFSQPSSITSLQDLSMNMVSSGDLDSLLSLHSQHIPLDEYTMGLPLFPTPTSTSSASPTLGSVASGSPSTSSPSSSYLPHSLQSTPSLPPLPHHSQQQPYRVQKQRSKPGPKPKPKFIPSVSPTIAGEDDDSPEVLDKRFRNNLAAKKYRQKKVDRISELELALADMTRERDELRLLLARKEAEGQVLREVMAKSKGGNS